MTRRCGSWRTSTEYGSFSFMPMTNCERPSNVPTETTSVTLPSPATVPMCGSWRPSSKGVGRAVDVDVERHRPLHLDRVAGTLLRRGGGVVDEPARGTVTDEVEDDTVETVVGGHADGLHHEHRRGVRAGGLLRHVRGADGRGVRAAEGGGGEGLHQGTLPVSGAVLLPDPGPAGRQPQRPRGQDGGEGGAAW